MHKSDTFFKPQALKKVIEIKLGINLRSNAQYGSEKLMTNTTAASKVQNLNRLKFIDKFGDKILVSAEHKIKKLVKSA
jgi:hypothetical protein